MLKPKLPWRTDIDLLISRGVDLKTMENLMRAFSNQGGVDYSQSHRAPQEYAAGRIPGYENMSFAQKRAAQMAQQMQRPGYRGSGSRDNER
jgi:hypothetical protein